MDAFVKSFFPEFDSPGMEFLPLQNNHIGFAYAQCHLKVFDQFVPRLRNFFATQPMTTLGLFEASIHSCPSSLDGLSKNYLTPGGGAINLPALFNHGGASGGLGHGYPVYDDGYLQVDRNQWWPETYPAGDAWSVNEWPFNYQEEASSDSVSASLPAYERLTDFPAKPYSAVDLRGLTSDEARFVLLMTGEWRRRTRARLDFALPRLIDNLYYRSDVAVPVFAADHPQTPAPPSWQMAWAALTKYVTLNRVFGHFSTALYLVTGAMYQMLPVTVEGQIWLSFKWKMSLPAFASVRGRFTCFNEEEAAFGNQRAFDEWGYISNRLHRREWGFEVHAEV
ncbi:OLC1v1035615C1 [Oldenlandia corymbosa var. corymbosa]|uniref:OLC1v1035615C1 n=1 Tax=Oldenlandia corymbosa var. corymbosa TaxID=529605 RepID=A0AAV1CTX2_OLDCO|nr:OLC1v1035615C1 [Oldenlandia corymbosa var. corymbosa]